ncbi:hypothetical protein [Micromonospora deserti]|uniref:Uncharacterized protein n=1 Tax=Micromonospora deserti TaxID=2070366 RepID=A0A2W2CTM2_9ACTN|nr:hypothetical protein [Micromonospora deserti]PZG02856.1 hypothetical protein C1I99_00740 [Micromonospora deserti]
MTKFIWVSVAQPLYVARTGMERSLLGGGPNKTEEEWQDTLESAQSGLDHFCRPERVYGLGTSDDAGEDARPAYLTASGIYHDTGRKDSEVYVTGDDPATAEADARKWVSNWLERAKTRVSDLDAD